MQLKRAIDLTDSYMTTVLSDVPKLSQKGYPSAMLEFYTEKTSALDTTIQEARHVYSTTVVKKEDTSVDAIDNVKAEIQDLEACLSKLNSSRTSFDAQYGKDIKKLTS